MMVRSGFLVLDKPEGITSHDLIMRARRTLGTKKIGHAGTLDPMATGIMVLGVESATRLLDYVMSGRKRYLATIKMGTLTVTDDRLGEVIEGREVTESLMDEASTKLMKMVGVIEQVPAKVSAIKVDGKRSYDRVRSGEEVELKPRRVEIFEMEILARRSKELDIDVTTSPGTYIRAIARDVGGHLTSLRRIESAPFTLADCREIDASSLLSSAEAMRRVIATYQVNDRDQAELALGRSIGFIEEKYSQIQGLRSDVIAAISTANEVVALVKRSGERLQPIVVLPECRTECRTMEAK